MFDLSGRSYVVCGAGYLGSAVIQTLLAQGANVICLSSKLLERIPNVLSIETELTDEKRVEESLKLFADDIDGLVNCAGRPGMRGLDISQDAFAETLNNLITMQYSVSRIAAKYMDNGSIVNIGSLWGIRSPDPKLYLDLKNEPSLGIVAAYGGIAQLNKYLAVLLAPKVRVNLVVPGWCPKARGTPRPDYIDGIKRRIPMDRIGTPADIMGAIVYLLSDASSYMTGQQLVIDGGY